MWNDVVELREFYEGRTGQVARRLLRRAVRQLWPDVRGDTLLGLGYATPYLRAFREEAAATIALMPAGQGCLHWPPEGPNAVGLVDETELPLPDLSVDRVLLVHGLEQGDYLHDMLREIWRVMKGEGRLLVVAPNRRSLWAQLERTPFGHGHPYSPGQLTRVLRDHLFTPLRRQGALYIPPTGSRWLLRAAPAWERVGDQWFPHFAGVHLVEASKQLYGGLPLRAAERRRRGVVVRLPQLAGPAAARRDPDAGYGPAG
jgi:SAM-dependent methyltransferase